jgi:predicted phage terminase large subunit-like protein
VLIEEAGVSLPLLQDLRANPPAGMPTPIGIKPEGDKRVRMEAQSACIEAGEMFIPEEASWLPALLTELLAFPGGRHDDQVDSVSQFLGWLQKRQAYDVTNVSLWGLRKANSAFRF